MVKLRQDTRDKTESLRLKKKSYRVIDYSLSKKMLFQ